MVRVLFCLALAIACQLVQLMRTRKKIGADQIETRRGFGYLMPDGPS